MTWVVVVLCGLSLVVLACWVWYRAGIVIGTAREQKRNAMIMEGFINELADKMARGEYDDFIFKAAHLRLLTVPQEDTP